MDAERSSSTHPLIPPATDEARVAWLRLLRSRRVGVVTFYRLMAEYGSADSALEALPEIARQAGVENYAPCPEGPAWQEIKAGRKAGARLVCVGDDAYPAALNDLPDAPPMLWLRGQLDILNKRAIALVGARNASSLGTRMARNLARELGAAGFPVVSGLARGVDTAAHLGALKSGSIGVLAGGVDTIYPAENTDLARDLLKTGALMSERPIGMTAQARHFPMRNRIISGLAQVVVVVEAAVKSGSLITARNALDQGREVLAVPGHPMDNRAAGCNALIRDGARLVRNAEDIIEALPSLDKPTQSPLPGLDPNPADPPAAPPDLLPKILSQLGPSPLSEDQLTRDLRVSARDILPALTELELAGRIQRQSGGLLALA